MSAERHPLWQLADELQKDLRSAMARLVALRAQLAALDLPDADQLQCSRDLRSAMARLVALRAQLAALDLPDADQLQCSRCGLSFPGPQTLSEHLYVSHAGPEPQHWIGLEARIAPDAEEAVG